MEGTRQRPVSGAVARHRETVERYSDQSVDDSVRRFQSKWNLARELCDHLFESVSQQPNEIFSPEEVYPALPICVTSIVSGIFGLSPTQPLVEQNTLTEALMERLTWDGGSGSASSFGELAAERGRERVPA